MVTSEVGYQSSYGTYSPTLAALGGALPCTPSAATACLIDDTLAKAITIPLAKSGYYFTYVAGAGNASFTIQADAAAQGQSGDMHYFTDNSGAIPFQSGGIRCCNRSGAAVNRTWLGVSGY